MILVVDMNWKKASLGFYEFVLPIASIAKEIDELVVKHYKELDTINISKFEGVILSGAALKDKAALSQSESFDWIRTSNIPILGICAGMKSIALAFGLSLKPCLEIGMIQINTVRENPLFCSTFTAYAMHDSSLVPSDEFYVIAESNQCVQAIMHKQQDIYGVLFQPEVRNKEIIQHFIHTIHVHRRI